MTGQKLFSERGPKDDARHLAASLSLEEQVRCNGTPGIHD